MATQLYKQLTSMWGVRKVYVGSSSKVFSTKVQNIEKNLSKMWSSIIPI